VKRAIAILALCACGGSTSWQSTVIIRNPHHVQLDLIRGGDCARACRPSDYPCVVACPSAREAWGPCADDLEPGTCVVFFESKTIEREGRCADQDTGAVSCTEKKSTSSTGAVGSVLGLIGLGLLYYFLIVYPGRT
jgi:hypothetical protein